MKVLGGGGGGEGDLPEVTLAPRPRVLHSTLIAEIRSGLLSIVDDDGSDAFEWGGRGAEKVGEGG